MVKIVFQLAYNAWTWFKTNILHEMIVSQLKIEVNHSVKNEILSGLYKADSLIKERVLQLAQSQNAGKIGEILFTYSGQHDGWGLVIVSIISLSVIFIFESRF